MFFLQLLSHTYLEGKKIIHDSYLKFLYIISGENKLEHSYKC